MTASKRRKLELKHPNWADYNCEENYEALKEVYDYFKKHGTVLSCRSWSNIFVGLTV